MTWFGLHTCMRTASEFDEKGNHSLGTKNLDSMTKLRTHAACYQTCQMWDGSLAHQMTCSAFLRCAACEQCQRTLNVSQLLWFPATPAVCHSACYLDTCEHTYSVLRVFRRTGFHSILQSISSVSQGLWATNVAKMLVIIWEFSFLNTLYGVAVVAW